MKMADFDPKIIAGNFKALLKDSKRFLVELIFFVLPLLFFGLVWLPFFTARTTPPTHFIVSDFTFLYGLIFMVVWFGTLLLYGLGRLTILKPFTLIFRIFLIALEAIYIAVALQTFGIFSTFITIVNVHLNVGFYLLVLHFLALVVFTSIPNVIENAILGTYEPKKPKKETKKPVKADVVEAEVVTKEETKVPATEEPPVEAPKAEEKPEQPQEEPKPKPKKKAAEPKKEDQSKPE